jgi:hypothetical protein
MSDRELPWNDNKISLVLVVNVVGIRVEAECRVARRPTTEKPPKTR